MWQLTETEEFVRRRKLFQKKNPNELNAVLANLHRYLEALHLGTPPKQIQGGWLHPEPMDVVAISEQGGLSQTGNKPKGRLRPTRLYVYPETATQTLVVISLGDKSTQKADIQLAKNYVQQRKQQTDK